MKKFPGICAVCGNPFRFLVMHLRIHQIRPRYACRKCPSDFATKTARKVHENNHAGIKRNLTPKCCAVCGKLVDNKTDLSQHIRSVHRDLRDFQCNHCSLAFKLESHLAVHLRRHTDKKPFACQLCSSRFYTSAELKYHALSHREEKLFRCKTCGKRTASKRSLSVHMRIHQLDYRYFCAHCPAKFTDNAASRRHAKVHIGKRDFPCPHCSASFLNRSILGKHMHVHDAQNASAFCCELCKVNFASESDLQGHMDAIHVNSKPEPTHRKKNAFASLPDRYQCPICLLMFPNPIARDRHQTSHSNSAKGRFGCSMCEAKLIDRRALTIHLLRHRGQTSGDLRAPKRSRQGKSIDEVGCAVCDGRFADKQNLARHLLKQPKPGHCQKMKLLKGKMKLFQCDFCTAVCSSRDLLDIHRRAHTNEKPYACAHCPQKYAQKGNLIAHVRSHYRVHMFACEICPQTFYSKRQLDSHLLIHGGAGILRFGCAVCGSYHGLRDSLIGHLAKRHRNGPRPFACDVCPKRFLTQKLLSSHYAKKAHTWLLRNDVEK